jgi:hypothetical protein
LKPTQPEPIWKSSVEHDTSTAPSSSISPPASRISRKALPRSFMSNDASSSGSGAEPKE